jgi:outer membrane protein assembly factor BamB
MSLFTALAICALVGCTDKKTKTAQNSPARQAQTSTSQGKSAKQDNGAETKDAAGQTGSASEKTPAADDASAADKTAQPDASSSNAAHKTTAANKGAANEKTTPDATASDKTGNATPAEAKNPAPDKQADPSAPAANTQASDQAAADLTAPQLDLSITGTTSPAEAQKIANAGNRPGDWNQWGGSPLRNNVVEAAAPTEWDIGEMDDETGEWKKDTAKNINWVVNLGSQTYGNTVAVNGKVYVGTNNGAGYLKRYPADVDLGVLLCVDEKDGTFLWQDSSEKLTRTGRVNDWPLMGVCSSPLVEKDRLYYVTNRGEVKCLDTEGFIDGQNDGPITDEKETALKNTPDGEWDEKHEADVVWTLDMMRELGVSQHNMSNCSLTSSGDYLFCMTSNGVDDAHINLPSPNAPSFIAIDKRNGKVLWTDGSPGPNVLHGQWSAPAYAVIDGQPQVIFAGGDGWLYSFDPRGEGGKSKLLWKFDCNPKESIYKLTGATRNHLIGTPVIHDNKVFIAVGEDPEHGEGTGHLWCVDATKRGDVSAELVFNTKDPETPIAHKRNQAAVKEDGDFTRANPNSAAVWHYSTVDKNENGKFEFEETMHRTMGTAAIKDDLLFIADFSGLVHCVDAKTGKPYWTHDMLAVSWGSPLIAGDHVYFGDEDGEVTIFKLSKELEVVGEIRMGSSVYSMPIVANGVLYISNQSYLFAIGDGAGATAAAAKDAP